MTYELLTAAIAALATLIAGVATQFLNKRVNRDRELAKEEVETLARALQSTEAVRKATVMEMAVERVPAGLSPEQFARLLEEITKRLPEPPQSEGANTAIEGLINNYHEQALDQAKTQFWFSIVAATVGFAWILYSGASIDPGKLGTVTKTLPGVVMDAVAFLFFRQASETRQRATELYDRLRRDKQMTESAALVSSIEDMRLRSAVKAQLALHMAGLQPSPIDLTSFLSSDGAPSANRDARQTPHTQP